MNNDVIEVQLTEKLDGLQVNLTSEKYNNKLISLEEFKSRVNTLSTGSIEKALLSLYVQFPLRDDIDLFSVIVPGLELSINEQASDDTKEHFLRMINEMCPLNKTPNLLLSSNVDLPEAKFVILLRETKTIPRLYPPQFLILDEITTENIKAYLSNTFGLLWYGIFIFRRKHREDTKKHPRLYRLVNKALSMIDLTEVGINYIRRIHATNAFNSSEKNQRTKTARLSGHRLKTQLNYVAK